MVYTKIYAYIILNCMKDSSGKKYTGIAAAFWIAVVLILLIAFLIKQDDIIGVLKETAFFEHVFGSQPEFIARYEKQDKKKDTQSQGRSDSIILQKEQNPDHRTPEFPGTQDDILAMPFKPFGESETAPAAAHNGAAQNDSDMQAPDRLPAESPEQTEQNRQEAQSAPVAAKMNQYLCFISINGDGIVERKEVNRTVAKTTTPLTAAINALLAGPDVPELEKGYISLIPQGTRLLSASVQDKTAFVNFNQDFLFNKYGADGYLGQLMQVVYTATAFNTIENVQFLIEGQKTEYLGGEGVWIGTPLARYNFK